MSPMPRVEQMVETAIYVDDLEPAESFYREVLGLELLGKKPGRHAFFRVGSGLLLVFRPGETLKGGFLPPHGAKGPGHLALGIPGEELEAWKAHLLRQGVEIEKEVEWSRGGRSLYFRDPDGNSLELITPGCWGLPSGW